MTLGIVWLLTVSVLVPHIVIHGISIGMDDASAAFLLIIFAGYILLKPKNPFCRQDGLPVFILWATIIITGIVFSIIGGLFYINEFRLPTEIWQYVKRLLFFYCACYVSYMAFSGNFSRCLRYVLMVALLVGIIQVLPGSIGDHLAGLYARSESQLANTEKSLAVLRNCGVAGHSIAWGGFAMFSAAVSLGGLLANRVRRVKRSFYHIHHIQLWALLGLAVANTMFSGSRVAIAALLAVCIAFIFIGVLFTRRRLRFLLIYATGLILLCIGLVCVLHDKILFLIFRFGVLIDQAGGNRIDQAAAALSLLSDVQSWFFGVGNSTQRMLATSFGTEVEPVFLLANYGILGVALRYGLLLVIFIYAWRQLKWKAYNDLDLTIATILALSGYAVFSLGYFFYHELHVGMLPWLLFGWVVGSYYRERRLLLANSSSSKRNAP